MLIYCGSIDIGFWPDRILGKGQQTIAALTVLILGLAALLLVRRWSLKRPTFTHLSVEKFLIFRDPTSSAAQLCTRMSTRANHSGLTQIWFRNISSDGPIDNVLVDGRQPSKIRRVAGSLEVCKDFGRSLHRGDVVQTELCYDLHNSFPGKREGITHVTGTDTTKLAIHVRFHPNRPPESFRAFVGYGSSTEQPLAMPLEFDQNSHEIILDIRRPRVGAYYTIQWDW